MLQKKITFCLVFILFLCNIPVLSQERSLFIDNYLDPFITNPACTGAEVYPVVHLSVEKKWVGFTGSPSTFLLTGNYRIGKYGFYNPEGLLNKGPLQIKDRIGLGTAIFQENYGPISNMGGLLSYAYHLPVNNYSNLSFGMSFLMVRYSLNSSVLSPDQSNDEFLLTANASRFKVNLGTGVYYHSKSFFAGVSIIKILPGISGVNEPIKHQPGYFAIGGYRFSNDNSFSPELSVCVKKLSGESVIADLHSKLYIQRLNWLAVSYSTTRRINIQFGLRFYRMYYVGYNYGFSLNKIATYNNVSHEISLGINMGLFAKDKIQ
jgi:type IX secretion system PorP/SprF family membrane protein